jgi:hypothetical protein
MGVRSPYTFQTTPKNNRVTQKKVLISSPLSSDSLDPALTMQCNAMLLGSETGWTQLIKKELQPYEQFVASSKPPLV